MPQIVFDFRLISFFLQSFRYVKINISGRDILGLGRVTNFEVLFSLIFSLHM